MKQLFVCLFMLLTAQTAGAQVYTWTDENGKKHFSDKPPVQGNENQIDVAEEHFELQNVDDGYPITDPNLHMDQQESYLDRKLREREEKKAAAKVKKEVMANLCQKAKARYATIQNPVNFIDDNGRPIRVTEAERRAEEAQLKAQIDEHC